MKRVGLIWLLFCFMIGFSSCEEAKKCSDPKKCPDQQRERHERRW